jgi:hypothetical protein
VHAAVLAVLGMALHAIAKQQFFLLPLFRAMCDQKKLSAE